MNRTAYLRIINGAGIVAFGAAIFHPVGRTDGIMDAIGQDVGILHPVRQETDFHIRTDELHGDIVRKVIDGNRGIKIDLAGDPIHKVFNEPFMAFRRSDMGDTSPVIPTSHARCGC